MRCNQGETVVESLAENRTATPGPLLCDRVSTDEGFGRSLPGRRNAVDLMENRHADRSIRALHVVPSIEDEASGVSYGVTRLCDSLIQQGIKLELHCLAASDSWSRHYLHKHQPGLGGMRPLGWSTELYRGLNKASRSGDIIHNHSLWMMPNIYPAWIARKGGCKLVTSPHGTLSSPALARSQWRKRIFWAVQRGALTRAACVHATGAGEYHDVRALGIRVPVAIIPYGIDIPNQPASLPRSSQRRLLFLSRIHPIKGLDLLLRVWRKLEDAFPEWQLVIVGQGESHYIQSLQQLSQALRLSRAFFLGPRYGIEKSKCYWESDLFVLPTHAENFGFAVAEALAHGVPAVVTHGAPWQGLETHRCGWWIHLNEESLIKTLSDAMSKPIHNLKGMGSRGREWMRRDFSWEEVGRRMALTYEWILGVGAQPSWVTRD